MGSSTNRRDKNRIYRGDLQICPNDDSVIDCLSRQFGVLFEADVIEAVASKCNYDFAESEKVLCELSGLDNSELSSTRRQRMVGTPAFDGSLRQQPLVQERAPLSSIEHALADIRKGYLVLVLLRGLPGSGKSTLANQILTETIGPCNPREFILSADDFFLRNGCYQYNSALIREAHDWNQRRAAHALFNGVSPLLIDNTNTQMWEMKPYFHWAVEHGYIVYILEPPNSWAFKPRELARLNKHGVPKDKIRMMCERYERNITVELMFQRFDAQYRNIIPPQFRKYPPFQGNSQQMRSYDTTPKTAEVATCTRASRDHSASDKTIWARTQFINNGQLPSKYPKEGFSDKSAVTDESIFSVGESQNTSLDYLQSIFENVPRDYLVDILDKCQGDVQWSIDILLEDNRELLPNIEPTTTTLTPPKVIPPKQEISDSTPKRTGAVRKHSESNSEVAAIKKHIEENVVINKSHYSNHLLKLKGVAPDEVVPSTSGTCTNFSTSPDNFVMVDSDMEFDDDIEVLPDVSETDDTFELNIGETFVNQLKQHFGDPSMELPHGLLPVIEIPKSLGQQLFALYLESVFKQMENEEAVLQTMVEEDEQFALRLQTEEIHKLEQGNSPDLKQIMQDQMEAQRLQRIAESEWRNLTPDDLAYKLTKQKLIACFPKIEEDVLVELLYAHDNNYNDTVESLINSGAEYNDNNIQKTISAGTLAEMQADHKASKVVCDDEEEDDDVNMDYREEAKKCKERRTQLLNKAKQYHSKGMNEVAMFYSELARKQTQLWEKYNNQAAVQIISDGFKRANNNDTIDLHYLHVQEALNTLDIFIDECICKLRSNKSEMVYKHVITGRGKNSQNGIPRIRPSVQVRLHKRNIKFRMINQGLLKIKIMHNSLMTEEILKRTEVKF